MSFGATSALSELAKLYYERGRSLSMEALKSKYPPLLAEGKLSPKNTLREPPSRASNSKAPGSARCSWVSE
jgi:hypothetical protein